MVIVQYLLVHLSVEAFRSKLKHFHCKTCITLSDSDDLAKNSEEQETTAYFCDHI